MGKAISKYISYKEATDSNTAIANNIVNNPDARQIEAMKYVGEEVFDKVRQHFGVKIGITSFFRSTELNKMVGGSSSSFHLLGAAIDIDADIFGGIKNSQIFNYIKDNLPFTELVWEFGNNSEPSWVHVALVKGRENEKRIKYIK